MLTFADAGVSVPNLNPRLNPKPLRWASCAQHLSTMGYERHLVRPGALTTVCGGSATHPEIWRGNTRKPYCKTCITRAFERGVEFPERDAALAFLADQS